MKTREEFKKAINEMLFEAEKSGFTLCIGFDAEGIAMIAGQGNRPAMLGLAQLMSQQFLSDLISDKKQWPI
jgi:hypothetical protein